MKKIVITALTVAFIAAFSLNVESAEEQEKARG